MNGRAERACFGLSADGDDVGPHVIGFGLVARIRVDHVSNAGCTLQCAGGIPYTHVTPTDLNHRLTSIVRQGPVRAIPGWLSKFPSNRCLAHKRG